MKNLLKLEEAGLVLLSIWLFKLTGFPWWYYPAFILLPDIGMLGYLASTRVGAVTYNIFHHKGLAVIIYMVGAYFSLPWVAVVGIILLGHSSLDRILGYGLKFGDHFKHTHLGWLNQDKL